jgi:hypothetical protein
MSEESSDRTKWLVDPPRPGEVMLQLALGDGVELTDDQRTALDNLIASLQESDEVGGFEKCDQQCHLAMCKPDIRTGPCPGNETPCNLWSGSIKTTFF